MRACVHCGDTGAVLTRDGSLDACRACAGIAQAAWEIVMTERRASMWTEHVNDAGRGSDPSAVTVAALRGKLVLTVGRPVQMELPWYRAGTAVAMLLGAGSEAGKVRIVRGDTHRLLAAVRGQSTLEKMPPVILRVDGLPHMMPGEDHAPEAVSYRVERGLLDVKLPAWAAPPVPVLPPVTSYQPAIFAPVERTARGAA